MFTGLVEGVGEIVELRRLAEGLRLAVAPPFPVAELDLGESVAVSGACLTVVAVQGRAFQVDVSPETLARSTLSAKQVGDRVNLERALRLGDRLGGHLVTGHVDGLGVLKERRQGPQHLELAFGLPAPLAPLVIEKGSIAVDGVSLTVNAVRDQVFTVNVIPFTARDTTLGGLKVGDRVNLETDIIGKYVARLLGPHLPSKSGLTEEFLERHGFR
jgi:riboflavin synthase|uniref:Riboflavin synthase n=1 Tax=Desulfobacca acetoxidans TaxID=60893 RepID=A0A7C3UXX2_9BACT